MLRVVSTLLTITSDFEIILVDDCSPDKSWRTIKELSRNNKHVKGILLSRNYGQHAAIKAGLDYSNGEWIAVMDCDLQDRPEDIFQLYNLAMKGNLCVASIRKIKKERVFKRITAFLFYFFFKLQTGVQLNTGTANFGIYHRSIVEQIKSMNHKIIFFPLMVRRTDAVVIELSINCGDRLAGKSSYTIPRLLKFGWKIFFRNENAPVYEIKEITPAHDSI